jgi:Methyltransferase domain
MLKKILPGNFTKNVKTFIKDTFHFKDYQQHIEDFLIKRKLYENHIPKHDLESIHIKNIQVLLNREVLLDKMPKASVCAEIGVNEGAFSDEILKITKPAKIHLIDAWGNPERYHDGLKLVIEDKFEKEIKRGMVEVNVGLSTTVLKNMPDKYFDWVYLDTEHSYFVTAEELQILQNKVKPGGIIAGHDYIIGNWVGDVRYGVIEAVHELCVNSGWEMIFLTINKNEVPSFAIRKIENQGDNYTV